MSAVQHFTPDVGLPAEQSLNEHDAKYLLQAIGLSATARERGNRPFGAVIAGSDGRVLAEAWNATAETGDCTAHAETAAVRLASPHHSREALADATMYASGEPCVMCAGAIFWSGIGRVVFGIDAVRLRAFRGERHDQTDLEMSCQDVLNTSSRRIECIGPALIDAASKPHIGSWKA